MDEMKIGSKFMKNLVVKPVEKAVKKRTGCEVGIQLNELAVTVTDGKTARVHVDANVEMETSELMKYLKINGLV